ncbi:unnamed protein product [Linum tenue]|uniref:non-specific serine/threonine protein kinase n=1 Tax=Linum tenue TaxID=586396 RepID=A0AAV0KHS4_9ROSI|nr:unnamed protein product [Linum tenue]
MPSRAILSSPPPPPPFSDHHHHIPRPSFLLKSRILFLSLTISATAVIIFTILCFLYHYFRSRRRARTIPFDDSPLAAAKLKRFTYSDLKLATNDFHDSSVIGRGGSATVFRAIARDGKLYAVKRLDSAALTLNSEREFQNELHILGGLKSPFLVTLLGYCVEKKHRLLVYEYMPNKSLQEWLFGEGNLGMEVLTWERRFSVIADVARALEFLHTGCDPPVIHGDVKPSNVLLDFDLRAKISDFGLSRVKGEPGFGPDLFTSQDFGKSQELSGNLTPLESSAANNEVVDFALALQASSSSSKGGGYAVNGMKFNSVSYNGVFAVETGKGKEVSAAAVAGENGGDDEHSRELNCSVDQENQDQDPAEESGKQWGKDWWWRQDGSGELCSKDYVMEWIGSQICPSTNPNWEDHAAAATPDAPPPPPPSPPATTAAATRSDGLVEEENFKVKKNKNKKNQNRTMKEWWREEHLEEMCKKGSNKLKANNHIQFKWKKGFKIHFHRRKKSMEKKQEHHFETELNGGEFSFRGAWRKKKMNRNTNQNAANGSEMWSGDLFSRELSSTTTSMRGTLCYVAPEYSGGEKSDIYSFGVLILVIVSGRRPLHVLASPMKLEKANLVSWCRQLAQSGGLDNVLELVDERLKGEYDKEQASLCINLALLCLQKMPELRPDIGDIVRILRGEMEVPPLPFEFSPSPPPPSKLFHKSRRKQRANGDNNTSTE